MALVLHGHHNQVHEDNNPTMMIEQLELCLARTNEMNDQNNECR